MLTRSLTALAAMALAAAAAFYWMSDRDDEDEDEASEESAATATAAGVTGAQINDDSARVLALVQVPGGKITDGGIETEDGKLLYSFDIAVPGKEGVEEVHIDAMTGALLSREHESDESEAAEKVKESPKGKSGR